MNLITWLASKLGRDVTSKEDYAIFSELLTEACYRELALVSAEQIIGNALSKCEIKSYRGGVEYKGKEWYRWNVEPNKNETSSRFMQKIVRRLCETGECLVVELGGQLLVADSFQHDEFAVGEDTFTDVVIGTMQSRKMFFQNEVLYWRLGSGKISQVLGLVGASYSKLLAYGMNGYQHSRGTKAIFGYDSIPQHVEKEKENAWIQGQIEKYSKFVSADNGLVTVGKGTSLSAFGRSTTYSQETTRDVRAMIGDIFDFTALAFGIPPVILRGDVQGTSDAIKSFLTFCIDPWADMLREEIVRKQLGSDSVLKGDDVVIDTRCIEHINPLEVATGVEKLISSGPYSVNEVRKLLDEKRIDEEWADKHVQTKNFGAVEPKGGE